MLERESGAQLGLHFCALLIETLLSKFCFISFPLGQILWTLLTPLFFNFFNHVFLGITFSSIFDRFWTPKGVQNQSKIDEKFMPKIRSEKRLILAVCFFNFKENLKKSLLDKKIASISNLDNSNFSQKEKNLLIEFIKSKLI